MGYHFTKLEKAEIVERYKNGASLDKLAQKFGSSRNPIRRILTDMLGLKIYTKIGKNHKIKACRKMGQKYGTINMKIMLSFPRTEKQLENVNIMNKWNTKNHNWISRPEALFYITKLTKNFYPKDIVPQYYIKEIKHHVDFAIPSQKLLFEIDGNYYHGHSGKLKMDEKVIQRDKEVDEWAKQNGWTIFRFNDKRLKKCGVLS